MSDDHGVAGAAVGRQAHYDAFVSYGHDADRGLAPVLQSEMQRYARPWYRARGLRVFRDDANLAAEPGLWTAIERALAASSWFVLLASPDAAASAWVDREVSWWLANRAPERLLVVLTDGELAGALPPALRRAGLPEPRWLDLRGLPHDVAVDRLDPRVQGAVVDLVAPVRGIPKDELVGEHVRQQRRTRRTVATTIAGLSLLLVVALVASIAFAATNRRLSAALDTANARTLGQQAQDRLPTDPGAATQLALAAVRADPTQVDARNALGAVFVARRSTTATHSAPGAAPVLAVAGDPGVDAAVVATPSGPLIADGLAGPAPSFAAVPGAGPDTGILVTGAGRWVVSGEADAPLVVWDRSTGSTTRLPETGSSLRRATPDGAHLLATTPSPTGGTQVRIEGLAARSSTVLATLPEPTLGGLWQTADPTRLLVRAADTPTGPGELTLRDARTGAVLDALPPGSRVVAGGALVARCAPPDQPAAASVTDSVGALVVTDAASGVERFRSAGPGTFPCTGEPVITADGTHLAWTGSTSTTAPTVDVVQLIDLTDGRRTSVWVPASVGINRYAPQSPRNDDSTAQIGTIAPSVLASLSVRGDRAFVVDRGQIDVLSLSSAPTWRSRPGTTGSLPFTVGTCAVAVLSRADGSADAVRTADGDVLGSVAPADLGLLPGETVVDRGGDADRQLYTVITGSPEGQRVRDYALPSFRPAGTYDLVAAGATGFPGVDEFGVEAVAGGTVVVLAGGTLSWWSADTHRPIAPPVRLADDPTAAGELDRANASGLAVSDSGDVVGLQEPPEPRADGTPATPTVALWRPGSSRPTRFPADLVRGGRALQMIGGRLATLERPGTLVQRDVGSGAILAPPLPVAPSTLSGILGVDSTGLLATSEGTGVVDFWDLGVDRAAGRLALPTQSGPGFLIGDRLDAADGLEDFVSVPVDPRRWRSDLCRAQDRPFTDAERAVLPPGSDTDPPCSP